MVIDVHRCERTSHITVSCIHPGIEAVRPAIEPVYTFYDTDLVAVKLDYPAMFFTFALHEIIYGDLGLPARQEVSSKSPVKKIHINCIYRFIIKLSIFIHRRLFTVQEKIVDRKV